MFVALSREQVLLVLTSWNPWLKQYSIFILNIYLIPTDTPVVFCSNSKWTFNIEGVKFQLTDLFTTFLFIRTRLQNLDLHLTILTPNLLNILLCTMYLHISIFLYYICFCKSFEYFHFARQEIAWPKQILEFSCTTIIWISSCSDLIEAKLKD